MGWNGETGRLHGREIAGERRAARLRLIKEQRTPFSFQRLERMPVPSWRSSVALFDLPTRPQSKCVVREPYLSRSLQRSCTIYRSTPLSNNSVQRRHAPGNERALVRHGNGRLRRSGTYSIHFLPGNSRCALSVSLWGLPPVLLRARVCNPPGVVNVSTWVHRNIHCTGSTCNVGHAYQPDRTRE